MKPTVRQLPAAVLCLAMALSRGERHEALEIAQFVRGLAIQIAFRSVTGEMLINANKGTLLYSRLDGPRAGCLRSLAGTAGAVLVGVALFVISNVLLLAPLTLALRLLGADDAVLVCLSILIPAVRLSWTAVRAARTYRLEARRARLMPAVGAYPRWRLDLMGTTPPGRGYGAALLTEFVRRSDTAGATVYLVTEPHNSAFYRRGGFRVVPSTADALAGMVLMRRIAPGRGIPRQRLTEAGLRASR